MTRRRLRKPFFSLLSLVSCLFSSCSPNDTCPHSVVANEPSSSDLTASVEGHVFFDGPQPESRFIPVGTEPVCQRSHPGGVSLEVLLVKNGRLKNAFVYVKKGLESYTFAPPESAVQIDNRNCVFAPHLSGAVAHQKVTFTNSDPVSHNVHTYSSQGQTNHTLSSPGASETIPFCQSGLGIELRCDVHFWMAGYLCVVAHPYFSVTDDQGHFRFPRSLPAGTYTLEAWHEQLGTRAVDVTLSAGEEKKIDFRFTPK